MKLELDLQLALEDGDTRLPDEQAFHQWVQQALSGVRDEAELTIRIVGLDESAELNQTYRQKSGPTNVLSFPFECPPGVALPLLGDLVICAPVVEREAAEQGKPVQAHWAHMVIHGVLHLLGHDHMDEIEAEQMEGLEIDLLASLGYANPYIDTETE